MPHMVGSLGLFARDEKVRPSPVQILCFALSQDLLVDFDECFRHHRGFEVTDVFPAIGPLAMRKNLADSCSKFRNARIADITIARIFDDLTNIAGIGGRDGEIASHSLLDDVW